MVRISLELADDLETRIADLVEGTGQTLHQFMIAAIEQATERAVLGGRLRSASLEAEADALRMGETYTADGCSTTWLPKLAGRNHADPGRRCGAGRQLSLQHLRRERKGTSQ